MARVPYGGPGSRKKGWRLGRLGVGGLAVAGLACASGGDPASSASATFGDPTFGMTAGMTVSMDDGSGEEDSGDDGSADDGSADDDSADDGSGDDGSGDDGEASTTSEPVDGDQPDNGMYSHCTMVGECVGLNTCVTILDAEGNPFDGFCSNDMCEDPAADCDPSPGGDATPTCVNITLGGEPATACALDCTGGLSCPNGMVCYEDDGVPVCA